MANRSAVNNEIETLLIIHEKKGGVTTGPIPGQKNESSSSDSEDDAPKFSAPSHNTGTCAKIMNKFKGLNSAFHGFDD